MANLSNRLHLVVLDDDDLILQAIRMGLPPSWRMTGINDPKEADGLTFDAAIVDMHLSAPVGQPDGPKALQKFSELQPGAELIAMSGDLSRDTMEAGLKAGATRFLAKPLNRDELHLVLGKIQALCSIRKAAQSTTQKVTWIGYGEKSKELLRNVANLKGENGPILIEGPSGAGKEIVAHLIHQQESDTKRPFVAINVAAIPENLFESEVFGHTRGAFTGADAAKIGLVEAAKDGDLFLDEIEALPESQQAKLLRFLENGEIRLVGSKEPKKIKCRVIAATNRSLEKMVEAGEFREDLLWRLNGKKIDVPSLSQRKDDVPLLAQFFTDLEKPKRHLQWEPEALEAMQKYSWPGNVRELKRVCEQLAVQAPLPIIRAEDVWRILSPNQPFPTQPIQPDIKTQTSEIEIEQGLVNLMANFEANIIRQGLDRCADVDATAKLLGISRSSLYKKIKDHKIEM